MDEGQSKTDIQWPGRLAGLTSGKYVRVKFTTSRGHDVKMFSGIVTNVDNDEVEVRFMKEVNIAGC